MKTVACPTCKNPVAWSESSRWKPFCSERCKMIDLGDWIDEKNRIAGPQDTLEYISPDNAESLS